jgi:two-component system phosphate regulon sensor histidine kinase PhoR
VKLGVRGKLFFVSLIVMLPVGLASGFYLEGALKRSLEERTQDEITTLAFSARDLLEITRPAHTIEALDPIADRLGASMQARVTLIAEDGTVLGDSTLTPEGVAQVDNHAQRPEVARALREKIGASRRHSTTVDTDMLYVGVAFDTGEHRGVVRTSKPLSQVEDAVNGLRLLLVFGALVGMVVAVFMSGLASHLAGRAVAELVESARSIASGSKGRIPVTSTDELGRLAGSFNQVIGVLEATVAQLGAERDHLETILDDMTEGVLALDEKQQIARANRAACELLGIESPDGKPLLELVRAPALADLVARADTRVEAELELPGHRTVAARAAPLRISGGCVVVLHDVSEMRRLEAVRRDFVANVSHELRTPVAVIRANSETLLGGALEDPQHARGFLDGVHRNAERLSRIIADLLDLSRMEAGEYEIQLAATDVEQTVRHAVENVAVPAQSKNISLAVEVPKGMAAEADAQALDHVLSNLLDNAVKYTHAGGRVIIRALAVNEDVRIEVEDDGPGVEPRHRNRIFERFYRVDPGRSREVGGTGLGLSIVKHLMNAMDGSAGFTPATPKGSIFWIRIPRARTTPEA